MGIVGPWQIALVLAIIAVIVVTRFRKRLGPQLRTELQGSRPVLSAENARNHKETELADRSAPKGRSAWIVTVIVIVIAAGAWWVAGAN